MTPTFQRVRGRAYAYSASRRAFSSPFALSVTAVSVWLKTPLMTVFPRRASGVQVATTSIPCVVVPKALVKNWKYRRSRANSTPPASRSPSSVSVSVKMLVTPTRSETSMRNQSAVRVNAPASSTTPAV